MWLQILSIMAAMPAVVVGDGPVVAKKVSGEFILQAKLDSDLPHERSQFRLPGTLQSLQKRFKVGPKSQEVSLVARKYAEDTFGSEAEFADLGKLTQQFSPSQCQNLASHVITYFVGLFCRCNPYYASRIALANVGNWPHLLGFPPSFVLTYWHQMVDIERKESVNHRILQGEEKRGSKWERSQHDPAVFVFQNPYMEAILATKGQSSFDFMPKLEKLPTTATQSQKDDKAFVEKHIRDLFLFRLRDLTKIGCGKHFAHSHTHGFPIKVQMKVVQEDGGTQWWKLQNTAPTFKYVPAPEHKFTTGQMLAFSPPFTPPADPAKLLLNAMTKQALQEIGAFMQMQPFDSSTVKAEVLSNEEHAAKMKIKLLAMHKRLQAAKKAAAEGNGLPGGVRAPEPMRPETMRLFQEHMKERKRKQDAMANNGAAAGNGSSSAKDSAAGGGQAGEGSAPFGPN